MHSIAVILLLAALAPNTCGRGGRAVHLDAKLRFDIAQMSLFSLECLDHIPYMLTLIREHSSWLHAVHDPAAIRLWHFLRDMLLLKGVPVDRDASWHML